MIHSKDKTEADRYAKRTLDKIRGSSSDPEMWDHVHRLIAQQYAIIMTYSDYVHSLERKK